MCLTNSGFYEKISTPHQTLQECRKTAERITIHSFFQSPLPDSTHASLSFGISSVRPALFTTIQQKPRLSVAHVSASHRHRLLVCFGRGKPDGFSLPRRSPVLRTCSWLSHYVPSPFATTKRLREQLAEGESDWSLRRRRVCVVCVLPNKSKVSSHTPHATKHHRTLTQKTQSSNAPHHNYKYPENITKYRTRQLSRITRQLTNNL